MRASKSKH